MVPDAGVAGTALASFSLSLSWGTSSFEIKITHAKVIQDGLGSGLRRISSLEVPDSAKHAVGSRDSNV